MTTKKMPIEHKREEKEVWIKENPVPFARLADELSEALTKGKSIKTLYNVSLQRRYPIFSYEDICAIAGIKVENKTLEAHVHFDAEEQRMIAAMKVSPSELIHRLLRWYYREVFTKAEAAEAAEAERLKNKVL